MRTYLAALTGLALISRPDVTVAGASTSAATQAPLVDKSLTGVATLEPVIVELPVPEPVRETYLEVRLAQTHTVTISCAIEGFYLSSGGAILGAQGH